jgi:hypothetical protein
MRAAFFSALLHHGIAGLLEVGLGPHRRVIRLPTAVTLGLRGPFRSERCTGETERRGEDDRIFHGLAFRGLVDPPARDTCGSFRRVQSLSFLILERFRAARIAPRVHSKIPENVRAFSYAGIRQISRPAAPSTCAGPDALPCECGPTCPRRGSPPPRGSSLPVRRAWRSMPLAPPRRPH